MQWYPQVMGFSTEVEEKLETKVSELVRADPAEFGLDRTDFDSDADYGEAVGEVVCDLSKSQKVASFLIKNIGEDEFRELVGDDN
jgi:hypothetical protein